MHTLVKAHASSLIETGVPVLDGLDVPYDLARDSSFFTRFADSSQLRVFSLVDESLRQLPPLLLADGDNHDFHLTVIAAEDDPTGRYLVSDWQLGTGHFLRTRWARFTRSHAPSFPEYRFRHNSTFSSTW